MEKYIYQKRTSLISFITACLFLVIFLAVSNCVWAGNNDIRGWGGLAWGMTKEEVKKIDPEFSKFEKKMKLFEKEFWVSLSFNNEDGLGKITIFRVHGDGEHSGYEKSLVINVLKTLNAKYGKGTSIRYDEEEMFVPIGFEIPNSGARISIEHIWNLKSTTIKYEGSAHQGTQNVKELSGNDASSEIWITYLKSESGKL